jgi:hypothetical protein
VIGTYAELQTAVENWLNKSGDTNLVARVPEFIQLAEAGFRRKLDDLDQSITGTITITAGVGDLPADFGGLKAINGDFNEDQIIYSFVAGQIQTNPEVTGTADIVYKQALPALSDTATTNWLLTRAPDAYLFGALIQAEFFGWNDERLPLIKAALDEIIVDLGLDSERRRFGPAPASAIGRK